MSAALFRSSPQKCRDRRERRDRMVTFAIVVGYLVLTLLVGFALKRRTGKDSTISKFFVADGGMALFPLTAMLFGDLIAASTTTGSAGTGYSTGIAGAWAIWGSSFGCLIFSLFFCKFFFEIRKTGAITEPEAFGIRFNQKIRYLVLVFTLIPLFIIFSTQITAASMYLTSMLSINETASTAVVVVLFFLMAMLGISGVAEMNKVHSFVIFFGIAFVSIVCLVHIGGPETLFNKLPASYFDPFANGVPTVLAQFLGSALGFSISVTSVNIGYSASSAKVAEQAHVIVAIVSAVFAFFPVTIGLTCAVSIDGIRPDTALYAMSSSISPELAGLAVMAVFAAIFSTGPWFLLATSKLVVRELYLPFKQSRGITVSEKKALRLSRVVIAAALLIAVPISTTNVSLLNSLMSASQIKSIAVVLLLFGLYWKRTTNAAGFLGLLVGGALSTVWYVLGAPFGVQPFWPGLAVSVATIVIGSLVTDGKPIADDYRSYEERLNKAIEKHERELREKDAVSETNVRKGVLS